MGKLEGPQPGVRSVRLPVKAELKEEAPARDTPPQPMQEVGSNFW